VQVAVVEPVQVLLPVAQVDEAIYVGEKRKVPGSPGGGVPGKRRKVVLAPVVAKVEWVQCGSAKCKKWRIWKGPVHGSEELSDNWVCADNSFDKAHQRCAASEEKL